MRFAILEDDPAQMEVLTGWLREAGHDVHGFGLARELMRVASRESFDLFLVDWVLPDLTGEQVLRWLRVERGNDTPAIFITSRDAEEDIASAFSAGADDYLIKPPRRIAGSTRQMLRSLVVAGSLGALFGSPAFAGETSRTSEPGKRNQNTHSPRIKAADPSPHSHRLSIPGKNR